MPFYTHDNVPDSPINNFCTLNPLFISNATNQNNPTNGNLYLATSTTGREAVRSTFLIPKNTGKWYWEFVTDNHAGGSGITVDQYTDINDYYYGDYNWVYYGGGIVHNGSEVTTLSPAPNVNTVIGVMVDVDANVITFYSGGQSIGSANITSNQDWHVIVGDGSGALTINVKLNFGQDTTFGGAKSPTTTYPDANGIGQFHYQPPTGALALCTANLPEGPIKLSQDQTPSDHFKAVTWTGDGTNPRQITHNLGFDPDLVWIKNRDAARFGLIADSVRGKWDDSNGYRILVPSTTYGDAISNWSANYRLIDKSSTTFSVNAGVSSNESGKKFIAWCWRAAGAPAENQAKIINEDGSDGTMSTADLKTNAGASITPSKVSANRQNGFSIVKYNGNGQARATVSHGLDKPIELLLVKQLSDTSSWIGYAWNSWHIGLSNDNYIALNTSSKEDSYGPIWITNGMTDKVFTHGDVPTVMNRSSGEYIAYCWHSVEGYSKFGSFTSASGGVYVYLGFKPALIISKFIGTGHWNMYDNARQPFNTGSSNVLYPDLTNQEWSNSTIYNFEFLSNGFRSFGTGSSYNSGTHLFMAFAEQPFSGPSNAR